MTDVNGQPAQAQPAHTRQAETVVHDLGYTPYDGPRRPQASRYRTIAANLIRSAWRGLLRLKLWLITTAITVFVVGTLMYVMEGFGNFRSAGLPVPRSESLVPQSFDFLAISAFFLSLMVTASVIANDLRTGAFVFYFSRPLRPLDYVAGKLVGAGILTAAILFVGPMLLSLFRLGLADSGQVLDAAPIVPKTALMGVIATTTYTVVPLAFSAISSRKRYTIILWAAFYVVLGPAAQGIATATEIGELGAFNIPAALDAVSLFIYGLEPTRGPSLPPAWLGAAVLFGYVSIALGFVYWRVSSAERAGLGGSS